MKVISVTALMFLVGCGNVSKSYKQGMIQLCEVPYLMSEREIVKYANIEEKLKDKEVIELYAARKTKSSQEYLLLVKEAVKKADIKECNHEHEIRSYIISLGDIPFDEWNKE